MKAPIANQRFRTYLQQVKKAKTDKQRLYAGWHLVEAYRGFKYQHIAASSLEAINDMTDKKGRLKRK